MKYYANCPVCAHKLIKGENGTQADIRCVRCKNLVHIQIVNDIVTVNLIETIRTTTETKEGTVPYRAVFFLCFHKCGNCELHRLI